MDHPTPEGVYLESRYMNHIQSFKMAAFFEHEVSDLVQRIESGRPERGFKTNRQHVRQLKARQTFGGFRSVETGGDSAPPSNKKSLRPLRLCEEYKVLVLPRAPSPKIAQYEWN